VLIGLKWHNICSKAVDLSPIMSGVVYIRIRWIATLCGTQLVHATFRELVAPPFSHYRCTDFWVLVSVAGAGTKPLPCKLNTRPQPRPVSGVIYLSHGGSSRLCLTDDCSDERGFPFSCPLSSLYSVVVCCPCCKAILMLFSLILLFWVFLFSVLLVCTSLPLAPPVRGVQYIQSVCSAAGHSSTWHSHNEQDAFKKRMQVKQRSLRLMGRSPPV
jgi:hypothetical protein